MTSLEKCMVKPVIHGLCEKVEMRKEFKVDASEIMKFKEEVLGWFKHVVRMKGVKGGYLMPCEWKKKP